MQFCFPLAAALACVLFLAACTEPPPSSGSLPSPPPSSAAAAPEATPAPAATSVPDPTAAPAASPAPADPGGGADAFDPDAADYRGSVTELTDTGFLLNPAVMAGAGIMASAGGGDTEMAVYCDSGTTYLAVYADGAGNSRQEPGDAGLVTPGAFVWLTGSREGDAFAADAVAVLNP